MKRKWLPILCTLALLLSAFPFANAATEGGANGENPNIPAEESPVLTEETEPGQDGREEGEETPSENPEGETEGENAGEGGEETPAETSEPLPPEETPAETSEPVPSEEVPEEIPPEAVPIIVGLAFGGSALPGANLQVDVGTGYRFGYLDENRMFHCLGTTEEIHISMAKTTTMWYGEWNGYVGYTDKITSAIVVGSYHLEYPAEAASYEEALTAAQNYVGGFPAWIQGSWKVRSGAYATIEEAQAQAAAVGASVIENSMYGISVLKRGTTQILFQFDGGVDVPLVVKPGLTDEIKTVTWFRGVRYYGAFQYYRVNGGNLTVSNILPLNDYAECVISQEMSPSWPIEALKAQAICARTYYELRLRTGTHRGSGFDICCNTHCQAYCGMEKTNARTAQATAETTGLRVWYQGEPAETYYFSSSGGASEDVRNVWGSKEYPYLCGVIDPYEAMSDQYNPYASWTATFTSSQLTQMLRDKGYGNAAIVDFRVKEYTTNGNVKSIEFIDAAGRSWPFTKDGVRTFLGLRSLRYTVSASGATAGGAYYTQDGEALESMYGVYAVGGDGEPRQLEGELWVITSSGTEKIPAPYGGSATGEILFTVKGSGWGHNVGMSQWGAWAMASQGFTCEEILTFYYPGVEIY